MLSVSHFSCHFDSDLIGWLVSGDGKWEMCVEGKLITLETKSATEPQSHFSICQSVRNSLFAVAHLYSCGFPHPKLPRWVIKLWSNKPQLGHRTLQTVLKCRWVAQAEEHPSTRSLKILSMHMRVDFKLPGVWELLSFKWLS